MNAEIGSAEMRSESSVSVVFVFKRTLVEVGFRLGLGSRERWSVSVVRDSRSSGYTLSSPFKPMENFFRYSLGLEPS